MTSTALHDSRSAALVEAVRPKQMLKNLLVAAVPLAAGTIARRDVALATIVAFVCFCLASGAVYLVNDVLDAPADRLHPVKCARPIASGRVSSGTALAAAATLAAAALLLSAAFERPLLLVLATYLVLQAAYVLGLKHQPVLDLAVVASGFLLRAIAGGPGTDTPVSRWFLLVTSFASLFVVAGKRYSEILRVGADRGTRKVLDRYTDTYLRFVWTLAAGVTVTSYCLWAFRPGAHHGFPWEAISVAPFVVGLLRYAVDVDTALAGEPEEIVLTDPVLLVTGVAWLGCLSAGVFGG
jgi:decaprenyl-phosphate phosphoribosyltransferase